jgi:hypothetical protein
LLIFLSFFSFACFGYIVAIEVEFRELLQVADGVGQRAEPVLRRVEFPSER